MSSTRRGKKVINHDYYITPQDEIKKFLERLHLLYPRVLEGLILDPAAGGDEKHEMSYPTVIQQFNSFANIKTIDIREDSKAEVKGDYLNMKLIYKPSLIITNPPFSLAQEFITKALSDIDEVGLVVMLLRLNFFEGQKRKEFWKHNMPTFSFVHSKRMSFVESGQADSVAYMHCVWEKGRRFEYTALTII